MADWNFRPLFAYPVKKPGPLVVRKLFEDGGEMIGVKVPKRPWTVREFHLLTRDELDQAEVIFALYGLDAPLTRKNYFDAAPHYTESLWRFVHDLSYTYETVDGYAFSIDFVEHVP